MLTMKMEDAMLPVMAPRNLFGAIVVTLAVAIQCVLLAASILASHGSGDGKGVARVAQDRDATRATETATGR